MVGKEEHVGAPAPELRRFCSEGVELIRTQTEGRFSPLLHSCEPRLAYDTLHARARESSRARVVHELYRNLLRQARKADTDVILRHQISKQPVDVLQVASAGRSCRSIPTSAGGRLSHL